MYLLLFAHRGAERGQEQLDEHRQKLAESARCVGDDDLPDVAGGLSHHVGGIRPGDVEACEHPIASLLAQ